MIYSVINTASEKLNSYLSHRFGLLADSVVVSNLINQEGTPAITEGDKVVITLVNVQEEVISGKLNGAERGSRPVNLNLYILITANCSDSKYQEALQLMSGVISFFQANPVFNPTNTPDLHIDVDKITFEIVNQDIQNQFHLWKTLGASYMPSILYKMRMITIQEGNVNLESSRFTGFTSN